MIGKLRCGLSSYYTVTRLHLFAFQCKRTPIMHSLQEKRREEKREKRREKRFAFLRIRVPIYGNINRCTPCLGQVVFAIDPSPSFAALSSSGELGHLNSRAVQLEGIKFCTVLLLHKRERSYHASRSRRKVLKGSTKAT